MSCGFQVIDPPSTGTATGLIGDAESLVVSTIISGTWQQKVRLSVAGLAAADYRLVWSYNWNLDSTSQNFEARIQVNDATEVMSHVEEPTDSSGNYQNTGSGQKFLETGVRRIALSGNVDIDLDWISPSARVAASIWNARLELWRIS
jgi:hypothetical protein